MSDHMRENLLRLMAAGGFSIRALSERTALDERTIRGILHGANKPHVRTLHRLAEGLGVHIDELFLDPALLLHRRFDRQTNPVVDDVIKSCQPLFVGWAEGDFDELYSHVGEGGALTREGAMAIVERMNRKRELHDKLDLLLESTQADLAGGIVDLLYEKVTVVGE
jgi:transcriptional regulator with XRE-family HTH domain